MIKIGLAITGGGTTAIGKLLENGGASKWLHEVVVPYSRESMIDYLGFEPEQYCSEETARAMAMQAFLRTKTAKHDAYLPKGVGYGFTSSLVTEGQRADRVNICYGAIQSSSSTYVFHKFCTTINFLDRNVPTQNNRLSQEKQVADLITYFINEELNGHIGTAGEMKWATGYWLDDGDAYQKFTNKVTRLLFPGAFNPLHDGHIEMAKIAYEKYNIPVTFELCVNNIAKLRLDYVDLEKRISQFAKYTKESWFNGVLVSARPLFIDKLKSAEKPIFIVGGDTFNRICDPKFNKIPLDETASLYYNAGAKFMVFARNGFGMPVVNPRMLQMVEWADYNDSGISSSKLRKEHANSI